MERIGVRELRQNASAWLRRVQAGESFEVTDRGRRVALLVPAPETNSIDRAIAAGTVRPSSGDLLALGGPIAPDNNEALPSEMLAELRAGER